MWVVQSHQHKLRCRTIRASFDLQHCILCRYIMSTVSLASSCSASRVSGPAGSTTIFHASTAVVPNEHSRPDRVPRANVPMSCCVFHGHFAAVHTYAPWQLNACSAQGSPVRLQLNWLSLVSGTQLIHSGLRIQACCLLPLPPVFTSTWLWCDVDIIFPQVKPKLTAPPSPSPSPSSKPNLACCLLSLLPSSYASRATHFSR
jgi:hypothetical protein